MVCRHCGKEYSDDFAYCPYCAEPKPAKSEAFKQEQISAEEQIYKAQRGADGHYILLTVVVGFLWFTFGSFISRVIALILYPGTIGNEAFCDEADICAIIIWLSVLIGWIVFRWLNIILSSDGAKQRRAKKYIIFKQHQNDQTSICPWCGSHDIKVYRKGYDYGQGFWFRKYGGAYTAGIDANKTCCRCMECGKDWETDYDYRLIK